MEYPKEYPRMLAVAALVVDGSGRVLLHQREKDPDKGKWQLFATYVKPGEQLVDAVRRRLKEDGGVDVAQKIEFTGHYYDAPGPHSGSFCIPLVFKVTIDGGVAVKAACSWFSVAEAQKLDVALDNHQIITDLL